MRELTLLLQQLGGIAEKDELRALGVTDRELTTAVRTGRASRLRRGWYSVLPPSDPRHRARALGGRVTGAAALRLRGAWMWRDPPLSLSVPNNASRLPAIPPGVRVHWDRPQVTTRGDRAVVDVRDAFVAAVVEVDFEGAVALLDWSIRSGTLDTFDRLEAISRLPRSASSISQWVDDECQSFIESIVRTRLRAAGHSTRTQAALPNGQWIDIVVDEVIGLEVEARDSTSRPSRATAERTSPSLSTTSTRSGSVTTWSRTPGPRSFGPWKRPSSTAGDRTSCPAGARSPECTDRAGE